MADERRGLAAADEETRVRVARAGGEAVSRDREHMAAIGRRGGQASGGRRGRGRRSG